MLTKQKIKQDISVCYGGTKEHVQYKYGGVLFYTRLKRLNKPFQPGVLLSEYEKI